MARSKVTTAAAAGVAIVALAVGWMAGGGDVAKRAWAAGFFTNGVPVAGGTQYPNTLPLTGNETIPADTNLPSGLNPASEAITVNALLGTDRGMGGSGGWRNSLVGGDFGTNLWQRGTSTTGITTGITYLADRFFAYSGAAGGSVSVSKQTGAADITTGTTASYRLQRASTNANLTNVCVAQVMPSADSTRFQGGTAEFRTHLLAGANFSAAGSAAVMTIAYGTGNDESATLFSTGAWTGYTVASAQSVTISSTWGLYSAVAAIPATATQIGVKICFIPVGTAGTNDWLEVALAQLDSNPTAVACIGSTTASCLVSSFERRPVSIETLMQYRYYWKLNETVTTGIATGQVAASNNEVVPIVLPIQMRKVPAVSVTAGGFQFNVAGTPTAVTSFAGGTNQANNVISVVASTTATAGQAVTLLGSLTTGSIVADAEL